jgi:GR25 family glycosyltransferase involved in LPS biosynthesis
MFNAPIFKENISPDYSKYYDNNSPQWIIDIANEIKSRLVQTGGKKYKKKGGDKKTLIVKMRGGLGNRLFQILAGYGFAEKWNMNLKVLDTGGNHLPDEESKANIQQLFPNLEYLNKDIDLSNYVNINEKEEFVYHDIENPNNNATLYGYFQSEKYFPKNIPKINLVEPKDNLIKNINKENLFFIHSRRGDYTGNKNVNYFSDNTITSYYSHCIKTIKKKYSKAIFIIITNDNIKTKEYIEKDLLNDLSGNQLIYANDSSSFRLDSLYYMSKCKGGIAVNSTFSWFGTFFIRNNDKKYIFMIKPWFSRFNSNKEYDIYPSWSTLVDVNVKSGGAEPISKAYVINLDERTDRWNNLQEYFKNSSIELERVSGIRNKNGHLGCGLSIQKVIQIAKDKNMESVLIFEDDNKPLENFNERWQIAKQWLDNNMDKWDIFFGSGKIEDWVPDDGIKLKYKLDNNVNLFESSYVLNMNWIYVNKSVYDKILSWTPEIVWAIDRYTGDIKYMRNLFIYPFLSFQDNGMSDTNAFDKNYNSENNRRIERMDKLLNQQKGGKKKRKTKKLKNKSRKYKGGNNKYSAIIVEPRKHKALEFVLKNLLENLDKKWNIIIFHGNLNKEYVENIVNNSLNQYKNRISLHSLNKDNLSLGDYNALLVSKEFYNNIPTEMFLVFQTDSMINPKNKDKIYDFMQYDYVGAPWVGKGNPLEGNLGNGGFSLRRKSKMLEIIDKVPYATFAEDAYFALPPPSIQINKPTMEQAQKFSSEGLWDKESFGLHKTWVHVDNTILINEFPEIKQLIDLQGVQEGGNTSTDIVITFHSKDAKILPYTLKGLENINKGNIYLITNEDPKIENTIFIDENSFPFKKDDLIEYIGEENGHRAGWYYQQLLKLYAFKIVPNLSENFLIVDSETVFLNPVNFLDGDKLLFATGKENHTPYFDHMKCMFNGDLIKKYPEKSGIVHHMIFSKKYLQEMFNKIQEIKNEEPWRAFMKCVNRADAGVSGMSEYEIFFNYMLQYQANNAQIRELRWANIQDVPNYSNYNSIDELLAECKNNYDFITLHEMYFRGTKMNLEQNGGNNNKKLIIKPHLPAGFFSQFNKLITVLVDNPEVTEIEFDMKSGNKDSHFNYIKEGEELFSKIFETYDEKKPISETLVKEGFENLTITMGNAIHFYNDNRSKLKPYHEAFKKYIKIKPNVKNKIDKIMKEIRKDNPKQIIGILVRSQALANEQPNGRMPTQQNYKKIIDSIDKSKKTKYFICADNDFDLEYYKNALTPNYYLKDLSRSLNNKSNSPHRNNDYKSLEELENIFIQVVILSKCDILLHCVSNMATAALYMNDNQESKSIFVEFKE